MAIALKREHFDKALDGNFSLTLYYKSQEIRVGLEKITSFTSAEFLKKRAQVQGALQQLETARLNYNYCPKALRETAPIGDMNSVTKELERCTVQALKTIDEIPLEKTLDKDTYELQQLAFKIVKIIEDVMGSPDIV